MKNLIAGLFLGAATLGFAEDGWTPLFDGHSFAGWTFDTREPVAPETIWSVQDGTIVVRGKDKTVGVMRTDQSYADYELEFEWRFPNGGGNSGCLIHTSTPREINIWPKSIEVQLMSENAGDFWLIGESIDVDEKQIALDKEGNPSRRRMNLVDGAENPLGEWNQMRIVTKGSSVEVFVNGSLVNKGWNASATKGAICLQAEKADIEFRHIRIRTE